MCTCAGMQSWHCHGIAMALPLALRVRLDSVRACGNKVLKTTKSQAHQRRLLVCLVFLFLLWHAQQASSCSTRQTLNRRALLPSRASYTKPFSGEARLLQTVWQNALRTVGPHTVNTENVRNAKGRSLSLAANVCGDEAINSTLDAQH